MHDPYADHPLIVTAFAPHSTFALSDESFAALRVLADQLDVRVQIHLHESAAEVDISMREKGKRPFQRLLDAGLVNASLLAVHAVHMNEEEIAHFAEAGVSVAHCPNSNLKLASGIAPVSSYRRAGVNVALGTDGAASNNMLDLFSEMRTAALLAKATSGDASVVTASEALHMATMGGACALGLEHRIGSIETGKDADQPGHAQRAGRKLGNREHGPPGAFRVGEGHEPFDHHHQGERRKQSVCRPEGIAIGSAIGPVIEPDLR